MKKVLFHSPVCCKAFVILAIPSSTQVIIAVKAKITQNFIYIFYDPFISNSPSVLNAHNGSSRQILFLLIFEPLTCVSSSGFIFNIGIYIDRFILVELAEVYVQRCRPYVETKAINGNSQNVETYARWERYQ